jgi:hypothetical protein
VVGFAIDVIAMAVASFGLLAAPRFGFREVAHMIVPPCSAIAELFVLMGCV